MTTLFDQVLDGDTIRAARSPWASDEEERHLVREGMPDAPVVGADKVGNYYFSMVEEGDYVDAPNIGTAIRRILGGDATLKGCSYCSSTPTRRR